MLYVTKYWKFLAGLVLLVAVFFAGLYVNHKFSNKNQEKIAEKTEEVNKTTTDKKVVIVKAPDGTVTETTVEHTESNTTKDSTKKTTTKTTPKTKYRVGVFAEKKVDKLDLTPPTWGVSAGMNVYGPFWGDATYNFQNKEVTLGVSVQF